MTASKGVNLGRGDYYANDLVPLWGVPDGSALAPSGSGWHRTAIFGDTSATGPHPHNAIISAAPGRVSWSTTVSRRGNGSVLLEVQDNDVGGSSYNRVQLEGSAITSGAADGRLYPGDDVWFAFSVLFPTGYPIGPAGGDFQVLYQAFASSVDNLTEGGSPPFAIELSTTSTLNSPSSHDFVATVRGGDKASAGATSPPGNTVITHFAPATTGVWHDFLVRYRMGSSSSTNGRIQVWHRQAGGAFTNDPLFDHIGINVISILGVNLPVYHCQAIYRSDRSETQRCYLGPFICRRTREGAMEAFNAVPIVTGPASWSAAITADLPIGWWTLNDTSGATAVDAASSPHNGTYVGSPTLNQTPLQAGTGASATFSGSGQYVTVAHGSWMDVGDIFSMECWFSTSGSGTYALMSRGYDGNNAHKVPELGIAVGLLKLFIPQIGTIVTATGSALNDGLAHHAVVTKSGSTVKLYADGIDVTGTVTNQTLDNSSTKGLTIGARDNNGSYTIPFPGTLDEAVLYNYALTTAQVVMHYYNGAH